MSGIRSSPHRNWASRNPTPEIYAAALQQLGLSACQAAFVGHDVDELEGAHAVGMKTIAFNYDERCRGGFLHQSFLGPTSSTDHIQASSLVIGRVKMTEQIEAILFDMGGTLRRGNASREFSGKGRPMQTDPGPHRVESRSGGLHPVVGCACQCLPEMVPEDAGRTERDRVLDALDAARTWPRKRSACLRWSSTRSGGMQTGSTRCSRRPRRQSWAFSAPATGWDWSATPPAVSKRRILLKELGVAGCFEAVILSCEVGDTQTATGNPA